MADDYRTPGVYITEIEATGPIVGVGTSTAAFIGVAGKGAIAEATRITNLTTFAQQFVPEGPLDPANANLVRGVRGFFENGGTTAYVTRIGVTAARAGAQLTGGDPEHPVLKVTARRPGIRGNQITVEVQRPDDADDADDATFTLVVNGPAENQQETFEGLSMDPSDLAFVGSVLRDAEVEATPTHPAERTPPAATESAVALAGGADESPAENDTAWDVALAALAKEDEVSLVCAPGITEPRLQQKIIDHCESVTRDRFAILDARSGADVDVDDVLAQAGQRSSYAAIYHPWLTIPDPDRRDETLSIPPSGHVAGVFARVDGQRGVHKAPANEQINGVVGLHQQIDDTDHGRLNDGGVNVLRVFPGRSRPLIWGARTTSDNTAWRYVNVRRLFLFVEESIQEGIRWAVFEPNDRALWKRLDRTITEFLTRVWSSGALFGATADEAFFVKIDDENNPASAQELGQVFIDVGLAPVRPAEFVVVRIGIWAGGGQVQEG
jgi:phage tail sheath protein FI